MRINYSLIKSEEDIDILKGKESTFANLHYKYDKETIQFLKTHFYRQDSLYLVATDENSVFVALCSLDSDWWEPHHFFLREIFIMPSYQGQGIGKVLFEKCIDHANQFQAKAIVTETAFENIPMQKLCEKMGFTRFDNHQWKEGITYKLFLS
ncbi:MAG: GNAT family N-acetyltransferase [Patescibacteria group bacterium]